MDIAAIEARQEALRRCMSVEEDVYKSLIIQRSDLLVQAQKDYQIGSITLPKFPVEIISKIFWMAFCDPENPQAQNYTGDCSLAHLVKSMPSDEWRKVVFSAVPDYLSELFTGSTAVFSGEAPDNDTLRNRIQMTDPSRLVIKLNLHATQMLDALLEFQHRWSELDIAAYSLPTDADSHHVLLILERCEYILPHLHTFTVDHKIAAPRSAVLRPFGAQHEPEQGIELKRAAFSVTWFPYFQTLLTNVVDLTLYLHSTEDSVLQFLPSSMEMRSLRRLALYQAIGWHVVEPSSNSDDDRRTFPSVEELRIMGLRAVGVKKLILMFPCPRLQRLEIEVKAEDSGTITPKARADMWRFLNTQYPQVKALSVIGSGNKHRLSPNGLDALCMPDENGQWLFPQLEELSEEFNALDPNLSSIIHLCRVRLQSDCVKSLRLVRLIQTLGFTSPPPLNMKALQFYAPEVLWIGRPSAL